MQHAVTLGWWDRLWPLLATASLSLLVLFLIQVYIAGQVEPRKRREDRWEEDVRRLGEYLTFDFTEATDSLLFAKWWVAYLRDAEATEAGTVSAEAHRAAEGEFSSVRDSYRAVGGRLTWLVERVTAIDPARADLSRLTSQARGLWVSLELHAHWDPRDDATPLEIEDKRNEFQELRRRLIRDVRSLIVATPPRRPGAITRMGRILVRRARARRRRRPAGGTRA